MDRARLAARARGRAGRTVRAALAGLLVVVGLPVLVASPAAAGPCDAPVNPIVCENSKPGTPRADWFIESHYGDIEGYATAPSIQPGERLDFKVKTPSTDYQIDIVRLGYYGGTGGRLQQTLVPTAHLPQTQPACLYQSTTGMVDCGNWGVSASWYVPSTAVPGFYVANFIRNDGNGAGQYPFVVRNDSSTSDIVVQTSDQTWQAYNKYGDKEGVNEYNLYEGGFSGSPDGRAFKVSYNRPYRNAGTSNFLNAEYPMIRFLERNGYDVSYLTGVDITRNPNLLKNHKVYLSSGHDEYVNATQRAGIEAAKAAGVNLFFSTGNTMFWKTRFENSIDSSNTALRTMVCYKETKATGGAKIDPSPLWTGTWRDPRQSPPSDAGRPENELVGTLFNVNGYRADSIEVPSSFGRNRFWRGTSIATANTTTVLPQGTLGYEWDGDPDNGYRPAGSVPLSDTTVTVDNGQLLLDYGHIYGGGPANHKLIIYRDQVSKALVFSAATVQWAWGLDADHTFPAGAPATAPTSTAMQQATVNLLADMGAQPKTLMAGLALATKSTDTTGPVVTISSPAAGSTVPAGTPRTITGTAVDSGGGKVGSVEVSVDGGATYHRATGLDTWSYAWTPSTLGPVSIKVRASDDGATLGATVTRDVTVGSQQCPCTIFGTQTPSTVDGGDAAAIEVGTKFTTSVNATVTGVRFYKAATNTGTHTGSLWTSAGQQLATGTFSGESASGWQTLTFSSPQQIRAGQTYVVSYTAPNGHYSVDPGFFNTKGAGIVPLTAPATGNTPGGNGLFRYGSGFPNSSYNGGNYWVDVVITTDGADNTPPVVSSTAPTSGGTGAYRDGSVSATFNEAVDPGSVQFTVQANGSPIPGTVSVDDKKVTFSPTDLLPASTVHNVTLNATDGYGNALAAPKTWSFTTGTTLQPCPCNLFGSRTPATADAGDASDVELGVKFTVGASAKVTGVRFYKNFNNTGTHTGSIWTTSGQRIANGTFTNETATGWQTLTFADPVQIQAGQTYIASYRAPSGHYSVDTGYFANQGAGRGVLTAPSSPAANGNGVYVYGGGFPNSSYNANNYWVDPVVDTFGADTTPPSVSSSTPAANATGVSTGTGVTANFSEPINPATLQFSVTRNGTTVPGTTQIAADNRSVTFASTDVLAGTTQYAVSVRASDAWGNQMAAPYTWNFTTGAAGQCPCNLFRPTDAPANSASDATVELGMRITPSQNGYIRGVRFYKPAGDPGTHTGTLWTNAGAQLATGTFVGETSSGWQTLTFDTPVQVTAGTTYVVSYWGSAGHYGYTTQYFTTDRTNGPLTAPASTEAAPNGVYRYGSGGLFPNGSGNGTNYWVDAVFATSLS
ncbi:Ig-like domain-containing protein [Actinokineospora terrae]|uniref:Ig-like domain-containing protein n=1 Tax=Actinokineospora terrae TaxID=155974 RepID=A0A1H9VUU2_9PSEU|nr:Ig-like domain-containing protein [Actinokineospora terrae]